MDPYIPVEAPRVVAAVSGELAAVHEPARVTLISVPRCEPYGVIEAISETQVGWLGSLLLTIKGARARVIDPRRPAIVAEDQLPDDKLALRACTSEYALLAGESTMMVVDASLQVRTLRARAVATIAGPCPAGFIVVDGETLREWDAKTALPKRTWKAGGTVWAVGGTADVVWRVTRERPTIIDVTVLVARGQPTQHELPEPIVRVVGHVNRDILACVCESGRTYIVSLAESTTPRMLDTGPSDRADDVVLLVGVETYVLIAQQHVPVQCAPLAPPTWRSEIMAWTRSGTIDRYPHVPAIAKLAEQLGLEDELVPAITLCYGAHLLGSRGVPADELDEILGGRWPDEASGNGLLAATGLLVFDGWVALAPAVCKALDEI